VPCASQILGKSCTGTTVTSGVCEGFFFSSQERSSKAARASSIKFIFFMFISFIVLSGKGRKKKEKMKE
jgi:hypothetical protein